MLSRLTKDSFIINNVWRYIILLITSVALTTWSIIANEYLYLGLSLIFVAISCYKLIKINTDTLRKVSFMFNAIDCDDYAFKFTDNSKDVNNYMLNHSLNRIKEILTNAKIRAQEREKYYELIMSSVKTGILTISSNGNIYQCNNELKRMLGLTVFTHINQLRPFNSGLAKIFYEILPKEKKQYTIRDERGEVKLSISAAEMFFDKTKLKIISVNDINSAMDEQEVETWIKLTRVLTHEIMNSLAPITSLSETLIELNEKGSPQITKGLETIQFTGQSLISFVDSYRKFTRLQTPVKTPFELKPFLEDAVALQCINSRIDVVFEINPSDIMIYADKDMIMQVVTNLIKNALYAIKDLDKPKIAIKASILQNEDVEILISNNGNSIPDNVVKDIFMPFFTTKEEGSGIGLSVSRQIMHLHSGGLSLNKNKEGEVTFSLTF